MVRKKYSKNEILLVLACIILCLFILTFYLWHQAEIVRLGIEIAKIEEEVLSLREEVKTLETRKSSLLSLERVEKIAREKLNLAEPREDQILYEERKEKQE